MTGAGYRPGRIGRAIVCLALLGVPLSCSQQSSTPEPGVRGVEILEVGPGEAHERREYPGTLRAPEPLELAFPVPGRIAEMAALQGQPVEAGEVIARLEPADYRARLGSARAELATARMAFDRAQTLFEEDAVGAAEPNRRRAAFDRFEASFRHALQELEDTELRAPIAGWISLTLVGAAENVESGQPVALLQDDSRLEIQVAVPASDLAGDAERTARQTAQDLRAHVVVESAPGQSFEASVLEVGMSADPAAPELQVTLAFDRPAEPVRPGMRAKVVAELPRPAGTTGPRSIPAAAARTDERGRSYVWLVERPSLRVRKTAVELASWRDRPLRVMSGLAEGDWVAISGVRQLREGMLVRRIAR